jgi:hydrogenase nickel incorporation protein HypA/HybF
MHELSMSQAIADFVLEESAKRRAQSVSRVEIEIGRLSFLNPDQVEFWLKLCFKNTPASEAELQVSVIEAEISCRKCGYTGDLKMEFDPTYHFTFPSFSCPRCSSSEITVEKGRECMVKRIEILCR